MYVCTVSLSLSARCICVCVLLRLASCGGSLANMKKKALLRRESRAGDIAVLHRGRQILCARTSDAERETA